MRNTLRKATPLAAGIPRDNRRSLTVPLKMTFYPAHSLPTKLFLGCLFYFGGSVKSCIKIRRRCTTCGVKIALAIIIISANRRSFPRSISELAEKAYLTRRAACAHRRHTSPRKCPEPTLKLFTLPEYFMG